MSNIANEIKGLDLDFKTQALTILVSSDLFSEAVILKSCYALGSAFHKLEKEDNSWLIRLFVPISYSEKKIKILEAEINQELVDYSLRERIFSETEVTRNLILANAFSNTSLSE